MKSIPNSHLVLDKFLLNGIWLKICYRQFFILESMEI